jgi:hypothetical protein
MSLGFRVTCAALLVLCACYYYLAPAGPRRGAASPPADPIIEKKLEIFARAGARPADPELGALYTEINERYFSSELPAIPVMWDDSLKEVDILAGDDFHLEGMTNGALMLLRPELRSDDAELRRTVCHEAVHVKLHRGAGTYADHGAVFQAELRRIFGEGCFIAILASDAEQAALREWIDQHRARLNRESADLDLARTRLDAERSDVERVVVGLNERVAAANAQGSGWPSDEERGALNARRARALQESSDFNGAIERYTADTAQLNREVERYRLMVAYPRGVDEEAAAARRLE